MTWPSGKGRLLAGGLAAGVLVAVVIGRDGTVVPAGPAAGGRARNPAAAGSESAVTDLRLELLQQNRETLGEPGRDPFRFQARQAPEAPAPAAPDPPPSAAPVVARPALPEGPPPPPPIALRFIGLVEAPSQAGRVAILSDGRGTVLYGREGDTIEGRYRLLKVGADAVELAYVDGRGRQTVRLAGQ